uniref:KIB1-4 beta-propeller domain-containing protein n=1 Tax=Triticum urartu TaxID=4572 RepID=A0A8R7RC56_TRIUA
MGVFLRTPCQWFTVCLKRFMTVRFGGEDSFWGPEGHGARTVTADHMGRFYRKVVLSVSPSRHGSYGTAMMILHRDFGAPAFATAEDAAWKLAPSRDGVEDAIYHDGQFYSVSYSGIVEAWQRDTESGAFTSTAVTPRLDIEEASPCHRKYLAAAPGGRLMVVLKYAQVIKDLHSQDRWTCSFKVHVLGDDGQWK